MYTQKQKQEQKIYSVLLYIPNVFTTHHRSPLPSIRIEFFFLSSEAGRLAGNSGRHYHTHTHGQRERESVCVCERERELEKE